MSFFFDLLCPEDDGRSASNLSLTVLYLDAQLIWLGSSQLPNSGFGILSISLRLNSKWGVPHWESRREDIDVNKSSL